MAASTASITHLDARIPCKLHAFRAASMCLLGVWVSAPLRLVSSIRLLSSFTAEESITHRFRRHTDAAGKPWNLQGFVRLPPL
jgi:hypothetical protein